MSVEFNSWIIRAIVYSILLVVIYLQRKNLKKLSVYLQERYPVKYFPPVLLALSLIFLTFSYFLAAIHFLVFLFLAYKFWSRKPEPPPNQTR